MRSAITCFPQTWKLLIKPKIVYLILNLPWSWDSYNFFPLDISYIKLIFEPLPLRKYVNPLNSKIVVATDHRATKWKQMAIKKTICHWHASYGHLSCLNLKFSQKCIHSVPPKHMISIPRIVCVSWNICNQFDRLLNQFDRSILCWKVSELCCLLPCYLYTAH